MPFKSQEQMKYLWANNPAVAQEFSKATPKDAKLPYRVKPSGLKMLASSMGKKK